MVIIIISSIRAPGGLCEAQATGRQSEPPVGGRVRDSQMRNLSRPRQRREERETAPAAGPRAGFRRLRSHELVFFGDYVEDESLGFQSWEGPGGFRAGSFVKPVYRMKRTVIPRPTAATVLDELPHRIADTGLFDAR